MKVPRMAAGQMGGLAHILRERHAQGAAHVHTHSQTPNKPPKPPRLLFYSSGTAKKSRGFGKSEIPETPFSTPTPLPTPPILRGSTPGNLHPAHENAGTPPAGGRRVEREVSGERRFLLPLNLGSAAGGEA